MIPVKNILLITVCALAVTACQSTKAKEDRLPGKREPIEITGGISELGAHDPLVTDDPSIQRFPTEGDFKNPLDADRTHSVLDNTTAGGYTAFDDSVKVYPLPGEEVPAYLPNYAVPPLKNQYGQEQPMVGQRPMGLASAGMLPPVPNTEVVMPSEQPNLTGIPDADPYSNPPVSGAVRQPMTLPTPEPLAMQPPVAARPPMPSPFMKAQPVMDDVPPMMSPMPDALASELTGHAVVTEEKPVSPAPAHNSGVTTAGRRSSPILTGY